TAAASGRWLARARRAATRAPRPPPPPAPAAPPPPAAPATAPGSAIRPAPARSGPRPTIVCVASVKVPHLDARPQGHGRGNAKRQSGEIHQRVAVADADL